MEKFKYVGRSPFENNKLMKTVSFFMNFIKILSRVGHELGGVF
jgi:hypothetical protein